MLIGIFTIVGLLVGLGLGLYAGLAVGRKEARLLKENYSEINRNHEAMQQQSQAVLQQNQAAIQQSQAAMQQTQAVLQQSQVAMQQSQEAMKQNQTTMQKEFEALASKVLEEKAALMQRGNSDQQERSQKEIELLLKPLRESIAALDKSVHDNRERSAEQTASIDTAIRNLIEKTTAIGNDAVKLANALTNKSKVQGDWGEMILERMLEESGLIKNEEYFIQEQVKDTDGKNMRPDVLIKLPGDHTLVIDAKVSLTDYVNAVNAESDEEKEAAMKKHMTSVNKHIDELIAKDYVGLVKSSIGYVVMFMPNEGAYVAMVQRKPEIISEAYKKRVLVIGPSNLMMTLQLAYNLWQTERQGRNVEKIVKNGNQLYDKFVIFLESYNKVGAKLNSAMKEYDSTMTTLTGKGGLASKIESLRKLGLTPKKSLPDEIVDLIEDVSESDNETNTENEQ